jgi:hypothetical protein
MAEQHRIKRLLTFPIDDELREQLETVREVVGIPVAAQIRRSIELWLKTQPAARKAKRPSKTKRR